MPPSPAVHFNRPPPPPPAEMHEFISEIAPNTIPQQRFNPYAPPPPRNGLFPLTDFLQDPLNAGLNTLTKVAAIARSPTQMINHAATGAYHLIHQNTNSIFRPPGQAERVFPGSGPSSIVQDPFNSIDGDEGVPLPPPVLPLINCTVAQNRLEPLTAAELVGKTWTKDELAVRVFKGVSTRFFRYYRHLFYIKKYNVFRASLRITSFELDFIQFCWDLRKISTMMLQ